jgi:hypothetical protein
MSIIGRERYYPPYRRLRVFALDPSLATQLDTVGINEVALEIPWEKDIETGQASLQSGPVGEYLEVVDYDPASGMFYAPVDLNDPLLLAQDGLPPSEGNPQFHQQMVYAVAMTTIGHFEQALGRVALWGPGSANGDKGFVRRLRIYPHALREANAYYSPRKKALLFGYFPVGDAGRSITPGTTVFTCLSQDIVAHETTHALLDGMHPRFSEPTNDDVLALHEAFADIVALFQHFSNPGVLESQIARTRGDLAQENLLGQLAQQFGQAIGRRSALRDALGVEENGKWQRRKPDARLLAHTIQPHARGSILVAAVFDAFLLIYKSRIADLLRIASSGTGVLPSGEIHPDLVGRMSKEANKSARHVLQMCIRALDYCPPVDVNFGNYLRAIITADYDLYPDDGHNYRVAIIESFRKWGIHPQNVRNMSLDTLLLPSGLDLLLDEPGSSTGDDGYGAQSEAVQTETRNTMHEHVRQLFPPMEQNKRPDDATLSLDWNLESNRQQVWENICHNACVIHRWLTVGSGKMFIKACGLSLDADAPPSVYRDGDGKLPAVEVHSVRTAQRKGDRGSLVTDLVLEITQQRRGFFSAEKQAKIDKGELPIPPDEEVDFMFRRGCTMVINPGTMEVRRVVSTAGNVTDETELKRVRDYFTREAPQPDNAFHNASFRSVAGNETFAALHRDIS